MSTDRDILVFDIGQKAELLKWDGRTLRIEDGWVGTPEECWADWVGELAPRPGHEVILRLARGSGGEGETGREREDALHALARRHGARSLRLYPADGVDPCLYAARETMRRHRMSGAICMDFEIRGTRLTWLDRTATPRQVEEFGFGVPTAAQIESLRDAIAERYSERPLVDVSQIFPSAPETAAIIAQHWRVRLALDRMIRAARQDAGASGAANIGLICYGGDPVTQPTGLVELSDISTFVMAAHGEAFARVGLLLSDIVLDEIEDLPSGPIDAAHLRAVFGRLMDRVGAKVIRQGYDLDDTVCERFVEAGYRGGQSLWLDAERPGDGVEFARSARAQFAARPGGDSGHGMLEFRRARVRATIETPKPSLPPRAVTMGPTLFQCEGLVGVDDAGVLVHDTDVRGEDVLEAAQISSGAWIEGPATIYDLRRSWKFDAGWTATFEPSGDAVIRRES